VGFAFGAPSSRHEWDEIESVLYCAECGEETGHGLSDRRGRLPVHL
jgi:hypothetical protein